jgi:hypothetical protein
VAGHTFLETPFLAKQKGAKQNDKDGFRRAFEWAFNTTLRVLEYLSSVILSRQGNGVTKVAVLDPAPFLAAPLSLLIPPSAIC